MINKQQTSVTRQNNNHLYGMQPKINNIDVALEVKLPKRVKDGNIAIDYA